MTAKHLLWPALLLGFLATQGQAQTADAVDCSIARDPARCEAHQAALSACAEQRGKKKMACINEQLPPVDCTQSNNPARCTAIQRAKETCRGQSGKTLKACLKAGTEVKPRPKKTKKKPAAPKKRQTP